MTIMLILAALSALGFIVGSVIAVLRGSTTLNFLNTVLLLAAAGLTATTRTLYPQTATLALVIAGVLLVASVILLVVEQGRLNSIAHGLTGSIVGILLLVAILTLPYIESSVASLASAGAETNLTTQVAQARQQATTRSNVPQPANDDNIVPVSQSDDDVRAERPTLQPTVTPTPYTFSLPTPVPPICDGIVTANLNLRASPELTADLVDVIPQEAVINIYERDDSGEWLRTIYDERRGWVSAAIVDVQGDC